MGCVQKWFQHQMKCISVTFKAFWTVHCKSRSPICFQAGVEAGLPWAMGGSWAGLSATCHLVSAVQLCALLLGWAGLGFVLTSCISSKSIKYAVFVTVASSWELRDLVFLLWPVWGIMQQIAEVFWSGTAEMSALPHAASTCVWAN